MENTKTNKFQKIIKDHKGILYKVINTYCSNKEDRKDLEQEILIQLWKSFEDFDNRYKMSTWIYKIAMNVSISFYRKNKKELSKTSFESIFIEKAEENIENELDDKKKFLKYFIDGLNKYDKALIILYLENYSYGEISEIIGITESNVGTKLNRIKNKLREKYKNHGAARF